MARGSAARRHHQDLRGLGKKVDKPQPASAATPAAPPSDADLLHGPQLPGAAKTQDEIDALFDKD